MAELNTCQFKTLFLHFLLALIQGTASESTGFSLQLIPWDSPKSPFYRPNLTQSEKVHMMVMSSKARAIFPTRTNDTFYTNAIQIPVKDHNLRYSVNIKIGNPGKEVTLLLDTGSGPIWTRCTETGLDYNPKKSKSYKELPCHHPLCLKNKNCKCVKGQCVCTMNYGFEGGKLNQIETVLSSDSFILSMKNDSLRTFTNMIFGCSNQSPVHSGILGLDRNPLSLISQVKNNAQGRYSYCLYKGDSYLRFGNNIPQVRKDAKTIKIINPTSTFMFLELIDISVNQKRMGFSPSLFSYKQGGFMIDTGTMVTVLKKEAYGRVIQEFTNYYNGKLKRVHGGYQLDLCYEYNASMKSSASMTFHLRGADYKTRDLLIVPEAGVMCVGLIPGEVTMLGALQQWNTRFIFDINQNEVKFVSEDCSKDR